MVKNISVLLHHQKLSQFSARYDSLKDKIEDNICGYVPQINVELNSQEYLTFTKMVLKLFLYVEPEDEELKKYIEKLIIGYDIYDTAQTKKLIRDLHNSEQILAVVEKELLFKRGLLDEVSKLDLSNIHNERMHQLLRLYILMKIFTSNGNNYINRTLVWSIKVNETILHLLEENDKPFLDIAVAKLNFNRVQYAMGLRKNIVTVKMMQMFDLGKNINYHCLLGPLIPSGSNTVNMVSEDPLVQISWDVDKPVGGIKVIKNVETTLSGLTVKLEEERLNRLFEWLSLKELMYDGNGNDDDGASSIFDMISSESEEGKFEFSEDISPVSYTHLDVYKRQGLWANNGKKNLRKSATDSEIPLTATPFNIDKKGNFQSQLPQFISPEIENAYNTLLENFSDSWIRRVKEYKVKERREFEKNFSFLWGFIDYNKLPKDINKKVLPFSTNPFLMNLIIENIDIDMVKPFCGIKNIPSFIHDVGKGVPKNTEYSIMIPMHLDAKFSEVRWHLRDYPLPFVCIPPLSSTPVSYTHLDVYKRQPLHFPYSTSLSVYIYICIDLN